MHNLILTSAPEAHKTNRKVFSYRRRKEIHGYRHRKKESKKKVKTFDIKKFKEEIIIAAFGVLALINAPAFVETLDLKFSYPATLIQDLIFAVAVGVSAGLTIAKIRK